MNAELTKTIYRNHSLMPILKAYAPRLSNAPFMTYHLILNKGTSILSNKTSDKIISMFPYVYPWSITFHQLQMVTFRYEGTHKTSQTLLIPQLLPLAFAFCVWNRRKGWQLRIDIRPTTHSNRLLIVYTMKPQHSLWIAFNGMFEHRKVNFLSTFFTVSKSINEIVWNWTNGMSICWWWFKRTTFSVLSHFQFE